MSQKFWVIGGDYSDCQFRNIKPGTERVHGPYDTEVQARTEWQRLTFHDHWQATERYTICVEPNRA